VSVGQTGHHLVGPPELALSPRRKEGADVLLGRLGPDPLALSTSSGTPRVSRRKSWETTHYPAVVHGHDVGVAGGRWWHQLGGKWAARWHHVDEPWDSSAQVDVGARAVSEV
jgi:hypothetical protein